MKTLIYIAITKALFLIATPVLAQTDGYSQIEGSFINDCMTQPFPQELSGVKVSPSVRARYCGCYFDFVKTNFSYEEFLVIDTAIRENPQHIRSFDSQTLQLFAKGFQDCYDYATGKINLEQQQELENIEKLEQEITRLSELGKFEEATQIAEQIVEKKSLPRK